MSVVSTRVLKDRLSHYLHRAEAGERIVVLRDGRPVVALVAADRLPEPDDDAILADLAAEGLVELPVAGSARGFAGPVLPDDGLRPLSMTVIEDRT
ncbi:type II toxin-antitoxin system Phd/YefM family antitoxin [Myxococcota bacterium]|nr:type II toxin-antitoxin system Phd/YefM family antitoxin [Myxococcota bacterium]